MKGPAFCILTHSANLSLWFVPHFPVCPVNQNLGSGLQPGISLQHQQNNLSPASRDGLAVLGNQHDSDSASQCCITYSTQVPTLPRFQKPGESSNRAANIHPIEFNLRATECKERVTGDAEATKDRTNQGYE